MHSIDAPTTAAQAKLIADLGPRVGDYAAVHEADDTIALAPLAGTALAAIAAALQEKAA